MFFSGLKCLRRLERQVKFAKKKRSCKINKIKKKKKKKNIKKTVAVTTVVALDIKTRFRKQCSN